MGNPGEGLGGGRDAAAFGRQSGSGGKMKRKKILFFLRLTDFKLLIQMKRNSIKARKF